jgi:mycoredoxin
MTAAFTLYSTSWCPFCHLLKNDLATAGIDYLEVDIERDEQAAERVMQVNGGNRTVPTLEFSDGSTLTNPGLDEVQQKLAALV